MTANPRRLSLWWDTLPDDLVGPQRPALPGSTSVDVAIVGAGYTGLWTAYYLAKAEPSLSIVVLESETAGFGASGRNGGWASALFPTSLDTVAASSSREAAIALQQEMFRTVDELGAAADEAGIDCHFAKGGTICVARTPVQLERARQEVEHQRSSAPSAEPIVRSPTLTPSQRSGSGSQRREGRFTHGSAVSGVCAPRTRSARVRPARFAEATPSPT